MFRKNTRHLQIPLTSHVDELPEPLRQRLQSSWAETFYHEFFCRLDEEAFAVLYADTPSRPNVPVNMLVSLEFLKAANGWTDEEMYDEFCYNIQVRYALGYWHLGEGYFDLRTLYNFRQRLARHMQETGENLLEQAFERVTDEQLEAFALKTGQQRMDSTMLASNIRQMGRVQLLVTVLQRVYRMLSEEDRQRYGYLLSPYLKGHPGQYVYRLKKEELPAHLQQIGEVMQHLVKELEEKYGGDPTYHVLVRVFSEHFRQEPERLVTKEEKELSANSLQSPDDLEATYRKKGGKGYRGYVVNVTETCDPENPAQLITKVQVAPNTTDDSKLLKEALPELKERTGLETLYTDGGYPSSENDALLEEKGVTLIQTAIRGPQHRGERIHLEEFEIERDENGEPREVTCPRGVKGKVKRSRSGKSFTAEFAEEACSTCPLRERCPVEHRKSPGRWVLRFTLEKIRRAERRRRMEKYRREKGNLRAAVEATVRSLKHPFAGGKAPVRGRFRVACMVIGVAAVVNVRRLHRAFHTKYQPPGAKTRQNGKRMEQEKGAEGRVFSFVHAIWRFSETIQLLRTPYLALSFLW
jgi:hypothetical protein